MALMPGDYATNDRELHGFLVKYLLSSISNVNRIYLHFLFRFRTLLICSVALS